MIGGRAPERWSDEWLDQEVALHSAYGNAADVLRLVPAEARQEVCSEAHTMGNYMGGRPSDNIRQCGRNYLDGNRGYWREKAAQDRELEQAHRAAQRGNHIGWIG